MYLSIFIFSHWFTMHLTIFFFNAEYELGDVTFHNNDIL